MKTPSFTYMGGKARLRNWLLSYFPKNGRIYFEPFAGKGNVFFLSKQKLNFNKFYLNDLNIKFFKSLLEADFNLLPDKINKEDFLYFKNNENYISHLVESKITFGGKGYKAGYSNEHSSHPPYNGKLYKILCETAKELLKDTVLFEGNWENINFNQFNEEDFIYFDPPYFNTKASYPNINHENLIILLNNAKFRWALSGYDNELYKNNLKFNNKFEKIRNSEIKSSNSRKYEPVMETLWINY